MGSVLDAESISNLACIWGVRFNTVLVNGVGQFQWHDAQAARIIHNPKRKRGTGNKIRRLRFAL